MRRNAFAVFRAQSLLAKGCFSDMPRAVLYDVPVVREDDPAFISLLSLRMMRAALSGERGEALANADRLSELKEYLPPYEAAELSADCASVFWLFSEQEKAAALFSSAPAAKGAAHIGASGPFQGKMSIGKRFRHGKKPSKNSRCKGSGSGKCSFTMRCAGAIEQTTKFCPDKDRIIGEIPRGHGVTIRRRARSKNRYEVVVRTQSESPRR